MAAAAVEFSFEEKNDGLELNADGTTWLRTETAPYTRERAEETYKVFTHVFDFAGKAPITKGPGGKYTHHRGLFIGWTDTLIGPSEKDYDSWGMKDTHQLHAEWRAKNVADGRATQEEKILWRNRRGQPFIEEVRTISVTPGEDGQRVIDFVSSLTALNDNIKLRGDLQHAGMHLRMANEVSEHEHSTRYILPEGAKELDNDKVVGAWWVCCSPIVRDTRYWIVHMSRDDLVTGQPVYSIRRYARFGAFFEPDLETGKALTVSFRIIVSENELDQAACQALYQAYCGK